MEIRIPALAGRKFAYTNYSFDDIVASTLKRAEQVVRQSGRKVTADRLKIPRQTAVPPMLEQWRWGPGSDSVEVDEAAWQWAGPWQTPPPARDGRPEPGRRAGEKGAEATLTFTGTAVTITGCYAADGGRAEVRVDGKPAHAINAWIPQRTHDNALWHIYGLAPGMHTARLATTGAADARSTGTTVLVSGAIAYRAR